MLVRRKSLNAHYKHEIRKLFWNSEEKPYCLAKKKCFPVSKSWLRLTTYFTFSDIDECTLGHHIHGCEDYCNNTRGGYFCSCRKGYQLTNNNRDCTGKITVLPSPLPLVRPDVDIRLQYKQCKDGGWFWITSFIPKTSPTHSDILNVLET